MKNFGQATDFIDVANNIYEQQRIKTSLCL